MAVARLIFDIETIRDGQLLRWNALGNMFGPGRICLASGLPPRQWLQAAAASHGQGIRVLFWSRARHFNIVFACLFSFFVVAHGLS